MLSKEVYVNRRKKLKENFKDGLILIMGNNNLYTLVLVTQFIKICSIINIAIIL